ncbi:MAG: hypothetical protein HUK02_02960 [Bacteroidaceae bacterium]|mgnify:CR=1 FL=1|nr:hypothetical protein [Bacteroidaceae bacterium]
MKKALTLFVALLISSLTMAQGQRPPHRPHFNPAEFKARVEAYITEHAHLCPDEAKRLFPLYHEMKQKQREAMGKVYKMRKNHKHPASDSDCTKAVETMMECNVEQAKIEANYYKKMCKVIPACKVFGVKMADDAFHREMLQEFGSKRK